METLRTNYFKLAWDDLRNSPGWFGKVMLLTLLMYIPVFGTVVAYGYAYGWARDIAWGLHEPLPRRIFGNEDGRLYSRGFFVLVLTLVCVFLPTLAHEVLYLLLGVPGLTIMSWDDGAQLGSWLALAPFAGVVFLLGFVAEFALQLFLLLFSWVGAMRISIYDRLSAGFQLGKVWRMLRHDWRGLAGILGRVLLVSAAFVVALTAIIGLILIAVFTYGLSMLASSGLAPEVSGPMAGFMLVGMLVLFVALGLLWFAFSTTLLLVEARAVGHWTRQFEVALWRGQDDPMPFEIAPRCP